MSTDSLVSPNGEAGAPKAKIEITPEMIEAGENVIWPALCGSTLHASVDPASLAKEVFEAMAALCGPQYIV